MARRLRPASIRLLSLLLAAAIALAAPAMAEAAGRSCEISAMEGAGVRVWADGVWRDATPGPLPGGTPKVVTDASSRVEIRCDDGTVLTIAPESEINLEELIGETARSRGVILQIISGVLGVVAPDPAGRAFQVRTPLAIASVRSTEWAVEHREGKSAVFVRSGEVLVRAREGRAVLGPGEGIDIAADGQAGPVRRWGQARVDALRALLGYGWR